MTAQQITTECLIVGGGVIGLSIAFEMAKRHHQVCVVDQGAVGKGASWAGAGILPPSPRKNAEDPLDQLRGRSHELHRAWAQELTERTGIDTGYRRCGGLYIARSPAEHATLAAQQAWWEEHGIEYQKLTFDEAVAKEPALVPLLDDPCVRGIWYLPDECQLRNPWHLQALTAACRQLGVHIVEHCEVQTLVERGSQLQVSAVGQEFIADQVCVCSGAWARLLLDSLAIPTGIMPVRGQMVLYQCDHQLLKLVLNEGHRYMVAREDGYLLAGSCEEEAGYEIVTTSKMIAQLQNWAEELVPQLKASTVAKTWAGLRPGSFDGYPYMGRVQGYTRLFVASGHFRAGLHLSCATAEAMADLMEDGSPAIDLAQFRIARG